MVLPLRSHGGSTRGGADRHWHLVLVQMLDKALDARQQMRLRIQRLQVGLPLAHQRLGGQLALDPVLFDDDGGPVDAAQAQQLLLQRPVDVLVKGIQRQLYCLGRDGLSVNTRSVQVKQHCSRHGLQRATDDTRPYQNVDNKSNQLIQLWSLS